MSLQELRKKIFPKDDFLYVPKNISAQNIKIDRQIRTIEKEIRAKEEEKKKLEKQRIYQGVVHPIFATLTENICMLLKRLQESNSYKEPEIYKKTELLLNTHQTNLLQALILDALNKKKKVKLEINDRLACDIFHDCNQFDKQILEIIKKKVNEHIKKNSISFYITSEITINSAQTFKDIAEVDIKKNDILTHNPPGVDSTDISITIWYK